MDKREADAFLWEELSVPLLIVILKIVGKMNFLELVKARHSVRSYVERPIEQSKLDYILECVRLAPSAVNFQPWKFAVVTEKNRINVKN